MKSDLPNCIQGIISELEQHDTINSNIISDIISKAKISQRDFDRYAYFNHPFSESYGRNLIFDNGNFKIMLMSWRAGDFTAIHNHGYTEWGCVYFFGNATHRLYEMVNGWLKLVRSDCFEKGQCAPVCGELTHLMGNAESKDFTTLHIYGSNTRAKNISDNAKVIVPEQKKIVTTLGSAFLNMKTDLVLSEYEFTNIDLETAIDYFHLVKPFYKRNNREDVINAIDQYLKNPELFYLTPKVA